MSNSTQPVAVMCFSGGNGGMERSAVRLARFLSSVTEVILVCKRGSFVEQLYSKEKADYKCETIDFTSRTFSVSMLIDARSIVTRHSVTNVIFFGASELKTLYFSFIGKDINLIVWHGTTKSRPKRDSFHKLVYSRVNYHVALSEHLIKNVKTIVPISKSVVYKVIRPSFDFEIKAGEDKHDEQSGIRLLHVGRIADGKGQVDAVRACSILKNNGINFTLTLVGSADDSDYEDKVKDAINETHLHSQVIMAGYVENVNDTLEATDILLFPSRGEGMPNAFIEALHYNIVCIAYSNTVFPEFMDMGFYVKLVDDGNINELSEALLDIANNLDIEKTRSEKNMKLALKYFNMEREIKDWLEVLI